MIDVMPENDVYVSEFERFEKATSGKSPAWLNRMRKGAIARFAELGFPGARNEDWKFTNVAAIAKTPFKRTDGFAFTKGNGAELNGLGSLRDALFEAPGLKRLVFVNGHFVPALSARGEMQDGVIVADLAWVLASHPEWAEPHLGHHASHKDQAFTALNTAFIQDGAFIHVKKGRTADGPIHLVFVSTTDGEATVSHPRNLIIADPGSRLTLVESYVDLGEDVYFTNGVTEVVVGENALVEHCKLQRESGRSYHVGSLHVRHERTSNFKSTYVGLGGTLVRNEVRVLFNDEGSESTINGLYMASGRQHMDNHTVIDHAKARCASHELYKGILDGKAHGVFNGKIFVRQDAQKTDAKQTNKTLLLSDEATINTKPQLEIFADDVKCTHGATVGQLDEESIFYLRSRGIGVEEARNLLTFAFANDVIGRIPVAPVRTQLEELLLQSRHLPQE